MGVVAAFGLSTRSKGQAASQALPGLTLGPWKEEDRHFGEYHSKRHSATKRGNAEETSQQHEQLNAFPEGSLWPEGGWPAAQNIHLAKSPVGVLSDDKMNFSHET